MKHKEFVLAVIPIWRRGDVWNCRKAFRDNLILNETRYGENSRDSI